MRFESFKEALTCLTVAVLLAISLPFAGFAQGFSGGLGFQAPKTVALKQLFPPTVNLNQKHIKVDALAVARNNGELVSILKTKLVTMIQRDPRFIVDEMNPQTLLKFTVTNFYIQRTTFQVPNDNGNGTHACLGFTGKLEVSYQAMDTSNQAPLDSENLVAVITGDSAESAGFGNFFKTQRTEGVCGSSAKGSEHEAQDALVDGIVFQMGQRASPTEQLIVVKLPGRKLEGLSRLAMAERWGALEEQAEKADKLPKPEDDAYRVYLIAVAKEARAYEVARESAQASNGTRTDITPAQAEAEFQKAQQLLDKARELYKDALQAKPNEKDFQEADNRMERAVTLYAKIERQKQEYQRFLATQQSKPVISAPDPHLRDAKQVTAGTPAAGTPMDQIVKYCQANIDLGTITDYIKDQSFLDDAKASGYSFNIKTDPFTLNEKCGLKAPTIQRLMRMRLAAAPPRVGATRQ